MILLVSNSRDFATDFVVAQLRSRNAEYLRIDLDLLHQDRVAFDPRAGLLRIEGADIQMTVSDDIVTSVLFRAPTHLRESSGDRRAPESQLARHQWAAFARSLMVFEHCRWINHPCATYQAENKPYQLRRAAQLGFSIPKTLVTNSKPEADHAIWSGTSGCAAIKALDSFLVRLASGEDAFCYTQRVAFDEVMPADLKAIPIIIQEFLAPKIDLRVTVVGDHCYAAAVTLDRRGVEGDWRLAKDRVSFEVHQLPDIVHARCVELVRVLGLKFGAIDLALVEGDYYFIEINPTGEWAWLVTQCRFPIDSAIAEELLLA